MDSDRSCQYQPESERPTAFSKEDLGQTIKVSPNPTVEELAEIFQVHKTTVERRLVPLGFTTKFNRWVPHQMSATH